MPNWYDLWLLSGTTISAKVSHDSDSKSSMISESDEVLIPQDQDNSASMTDQLETLDITSEDVQVLSPFSCGIYLSK